jgi:DNA helicase-2/ATP-dependent DNA helicase PcrA
LEDLKKVSEKDYVIISTIHSAKGLEADMVYILDVNPGSYPSSYSIGNDDDIEEERRLLYVAMTRAKEYLYVCNDLYSQSSSQNELYFLNGIPKNLYESITISSGNNDDGQIDESELSDFEMDIGMDMS